MKKSQMVNVCQRALKRLDELETLISYLPKTHHAFVFQSSPAIRELLSIAETETVNRATTEQTLHIREIVDKINRLLSMVPKRALKDLESER